ncbi:MAG: hypothetical protein ACRD0U_07480 [Acidimicrobiales bacterium]
MYSNFKGKDELGLAVLDKRMTDLASSLGQALAAADATTASGLAAFGAWGNRSGPRRIG